jgi:hypothetical protein
MITNPLMENQNEDIFSVDVCLPESWLREALAARERGECARVTVVIKDSGRATKTKISVHPERTDDFLTGKMAGDLTQEPWWGEKK